MKKDEKKNNTIEKLNVLIRFLRNVLRFSRIAGSRGKLDIFADRLVRSASESNLIRMMEVLMQSLDCEMNKLSPHVVNEMTAVAVSADASAILRLIRNEPKVITMLLATDDQAVVDEVIGQLELPIFALDASNASPRRSFQVRIRVTCETPLAHGSDQKAGNATLFRRCQVICPSGNVFELPYYAGNALRGQMRDLLADHFLVSLGLDISRSTPSVKLWFFYALYSGGALEEKSEAIKAVQKELGDSGVVRTDGIREFRDRLPALSMLGCALGNRVLPGHVQIGDLRPLCREWGTGETPVAELMTWEYLTRREDYENHDEHHGMIATTECLRTGTLLEGGIDMDSAMPEVERSALGVGLRLLAARGMLGAENRRGFGRVGIELSGAPDVTMYDAWLVEQKNNVLAYLKKIGALV
jgi:hypothetical protein